MNKKYIWLLIGLIVIALGIFAYNFPPEAYVSWKLEKANYCEVKEDCVNLGDKCPFGCYIYVNENEEKEMKKLLDSFESKCVYGCEQCLEVECASGKCQSVCN
ncbi:MAG: hypothetical protein ACQEP3_02640 [Patescibacteria group bacterium]